MFWNQLSPKERKAAALAGMVVGAGGLGFAFFLIVYHIALHILVLEATRKGAMIEWQGIPAAFIAAIVGPLIGVIVGILLVNKLLHYRGSLLFGILGCIFGEALVVGLLFFGPLGSADGWLQSIGILLAAPLFGTLGFHVGNKKRQGFAGG